MYNKDEYKQVLNSLLENAGDTGKISEILVDLNHNYDEVTTNYESLTTTAAKLKENNDSLVKANGELFQYVGITKPGSFKTEDPVEADAISDDPIAVEDLIQSIIKEKGEI